MGSLGCFLGNTPVLMFQKAEEGRRMHKGKIGVLAKLVNHVLVCLSVQGHHLWPHELYRANLLILMEQPGFLPQGLSFYPTVKSLCIRLFGFSKHKTFSKSVRPWPQ